MPAKLNQLIAALPETVSCQWSALLEDVEMRLGNVRHQSGRSVGQVSNMLGVRREGVFEAAFALQKAG